MGGVVVRPRCRWAEADVPSSGMWGAACFRSSLDDEVNYEAIRLMGLVNC